MTPKKSLQRKKERKTTDLSKVQYYKHKQYGYYANSPNCPMFSEDNNNDSNTVDLADDDDSVVQVNVDLNPNDSSTFILIQFVNQSWRKLSKKQYHMVEDVLLVNKTNIHLFYNGELLTKTRKRTRSMTVHCQSGSTSTDLVGDYRLLGVTVCYNLNEIASVLLLSKLIRLNKARVKYEHEEDVFVTTLVKNGKVLISLETSKASIDIIQRRT